MPTAEPTSRRRMLEILSILRREYPEAECSLIHETPFQLLVATILSAQCTDARVNQVTPPLFKRFPSPKKMAQARLSELEKLIQSTGFYRSKAQALKEAAQMIMKDFFGEVPTTIEELTRLRGVGRKTANVILGNIFNIPSLVVDTHVKRLCFRMGFTHSRDPHRIELQMMKIVPQKDWTDFAHLLITHGRKVCTARRAYCERCVINRLCPKMDVAAHTLCTIKKHAGDFKNRKIA